MIGVDVVIGVGVSVGVVIGVGVSVGVAVTVGVTTGAGVVVVTAGLVGDGVTLGVTEGVTVGVTGHFRSDLCMVICIHALCPECRAKDSDCADAVMATPLPRDAASSPVASDVTTTDRLRRRRLRTVPDVSTCLASSGSPGCSSRPMLVTSQPE
jgi:hypothetical protein